LTLARARQHLIETEPLGEFLVLQAIVRHDITVAD